LQTWGVRSVKALLAGRGRTIAYKADGDGRRGYATVGRPFSLAASVELDCPIEFATELALRRYGTPLQSLIVEQLCNAHAEGNVGAPEDALDMAHAARVIDHLMVHKPLHDAGHDRRCAPLGGPHPRVDGERVRDLHYAGAAHLGHHAQFEVVNFLLATDAPTSLLSSARPSRSCPGPVLPAFPAPFQSRWTRAATFTRTFKR